MPFKARKFYYQRSKKPKMQPKRDWSDYNKKMKMRGDITIWLSPDVIEVLSQKFSNPQHTVDLSKVKYYILYQKLFLRQNRKGEGYLRINRIILPY